MSVLKNKRTLSKMQFYKNAIYIRKNITFILLKDFGLKDKVRSVNMLTNNMSDEDRQLFNDLANKYNISHVLDEYPEWYIETERMNLLEVSRNLVYCITHANTIYPVNIREYEERRMYQNRAISNCEVLLQEMQHIISILPCDINKYRKLVEMIDNEVGLLKAWRKSDNKIKQRLLKKGNIK